VTVRTDLVARELLEQLDASVGKGRYVLALTADHGVCPLREVSRKQGHEGGRVPSALLGERAEKFLDEKFTDRGSHGRWVEAVSGPGVYLNRTLISRSGPDAANVEEAMARWLAKQEGIQTVYTRGQLTGDLPKDDPIGQRVRRSFHPERCG